MPLVVFVYVLASRPVTFLKDLQVYSKILPGLLVNCVSCLNISGFCLFIFKTPILFLLTRVLNYCRLWIPLNIGASCRPCPQKCAPTTHSILHTVSGFLSPFVAHPWTCLICLFSAKKRDLFRGGRRGRKVAWERSFLRSYSVCMGSSDRTVTFGLRGRGPLTRRRAPVFLKRSQGPQGGGLRQQRRQS